jgi:hypothetical protein
VSGSGRDRPKDHQFVNREIGGTISTDNSRGLFPSNPPKVWLLSISTRRLAVFKALLSGRAPETCVQPLAKTVSSLFIAI